MHINLVMTLLLLDAFTAEQQSFTFSSHAKVCSTHRRQAWRDAYHEPLLVSPGVKSRPRVTASHAISTSRTFPPSRLNQAVRRAPGVLCGTRRATWLALSGLGGRRGVGERVGSPSVEKAVRIAYTQATYMPCCFA